MRTVYFFFAILWINASALAQVTIEILDNTTNEVLPFTTVSFIDASGGYIADINGKVTLPAEFQKQKLIFKHLGYQDLILDSPSKTLPTTVRLSPQIKSLQTVTVFAGENPAHPIIRQLCKNRSWLDPKKRPQYSLNSHNKIKLGADQFPSIESADTSFQKIKQLLSSQYFFLVESRTNRYHQSPGKEKEVVVSNKVSGFQNPQFAIISENFQEIGFFDDHINILDISYLNPIAKNSLSKYYFELTDSLKDAQGRKNYVITFEPKSQGFNGLKGTLVIDAADMALRHVEAETNRFSSISEALNQGQSAYKGRRKKAYDLYSYLSINFKIQQTYKRIGSKQWFPAEQQADIYIGEFSAIDLPAIPYMIYSQTVFDNISFEPIPAEIRFDRVKIEIEEDANLPRTQYKLDSLTDSDETKENYTYKKVDSLFEERNIEKKLKFLVGLLNQKITLGKVDIDLDNGFKVNEFEGLRVGIGLSTSEFFSRRFEVGGYAGYGLKDQQWKYGGFSTIHLLDHRQLSLTLSHQRDIRQLGAISFHQYTNFPGSSETFYPLLFDNMINIQKSSAGLEFYVFRYLNGLLEFSDQSLSYLSNYPDELSQSLKITEVKVGLSITPKSDLIPLMGKWVVNGRSDFYAGINLTQGLEIPGWGEYDYRKLELMIQKRWKTTNFGFPMLTMISGNSKGQLPLAQLFAIRGTGNQNIDVENSFRTMGVNEFIASQYLSLFYSHRLFQASLHPKYSKPQFYLHSGWAYGWAPNGTASVGGDLVKQLDNHYLESGLTIRQLVRISTLALGVGVAYRYGHYAAPTPLNNLAIRLDIGINTGE